MTTFTKVSATTAVSALDHAMHRWVRSVADEFGTDDEEFAMRMLGAWLHSLRDRLSVEAAARFAAHLPERVRGFFYAGWRPGAVPVKSDAKIHTVRFAREAMISVQEVTEAAALTTSALLGVLSPAQVDTVLEQFRPRPQHR